MPRQLTRAVAALGVALALSACTDPCTIRGSAPWPAERSARARARLSAVPPPAGTEPR